MKGINVFISAVVWFLLISLMSIDWAEVGKLILAVVLIGGGLFFVVTLIQDTSESNKETEETGFRPGYFEGAFYKQTGIPRREKLKSKRTDWVIEKGVVIDEPWISKILTGEKAWEMRSRRTPRRGMIALVQKGTKTVVGVAELYDCEGPLSLDELKGSQDKHCIPDSTLEDPNYKWHVAWKLKNIQKLDQPVPYVHKSGATVWVTLDDVAMKKISEILTFSDL